MKGPKGKTPSDKEKEENDAALKKALSDIRAMPALAFDDYHSVYFLEKNLTDLKILTESFEPRGFSELMREHQLKKLPDMSVTADNKTLIVCPYCFKNVTLEFCRVDHVIPCKIYFRYLGYLAAMKEAESHSAVIGNPEKYSHYLEKKEGYFTRKKTMISVRSDTLAGVDIRKIKAKAYNDYQNLLLCCNNCNSKKSNKINIDKALYAAEKNEEKIGNNFMAKKIRNIREILNHINSLGVQATMYITKIPRHPGASPFLHGEIKRNTSSDDTVDTLEFKPDYLDKDDSLFNSYPLAKDLLSKRPHGRFEYSEDPLESKLRKNLKVEGKIKAGDDFTKKNQQEEDYQRKLEELELRKKLREPIMKALLKACETYFNDDRSPFSLKAVKEYYSQYHSALIKNPDHHQPETDVTDSTVLDIDDPKVKQFLLEKHSTVKGKLEFKGKVCFYCFGVYESGAMELDHINPKSKLHADDKPTGSNIKKTNELKNLVAVCKGCNASKSARILIESDKLEKKGAFFYDKINKAINSQYVFHATESVNPQSKENYTLKELYEFINFNFTFT